jgi:hypothetical protein
MGALKIGFDCQEIVVAYIKAQISWTSGVFSDRRRWMKERTMRVVYAQAASRFLYEKLWNLKK